MYNEITRYDIHLDDTTEPLNLDFIANRSEKRIMHGTVWNDDLSDPQPEEGVLVFFYLAGKNYKDDPLDVVRIGYTVTDKNGEFFAGPFSAEAAVIVKVYKMNMPEGIMDAEDSFHNDSD